MWKIYELSTFHIHAFFHIHKFFNIPQKYRTKLWKHCGKIDCGIIHKFFHITYSYDNKEYLSLFNAMSIILHSYILSYKFFHIPQYYSTFHNILLASYILQYCKKSRTMWVKHRRIMECG